MSVGAIDESVYAVGTSIAGDSATATAATPAAARLAITSLTAPLGRDEVRHLVQIAISRAEKRAATSEETHALQVTLEQHLGELVAVMWPDQGTSIADLSNEPLEQDGMLRLDALGAMHLEKVGGDGQKVAEQLRRHARNRWNALSAAMPELWRLWLPNEELRGPPFVFILAKSLWVDVVKRRLDDLLCTSLPGFSVRPVATILSRKSSAVASSDGVEIRGWRGRVAELRPTETVPELPTDLARATTVFHTLTTQRLLRFVVRRGWEQRYLEAKRLYNEIEVVGGFTAMAEMIGPPTRKHAAELREAAELFRHVFVKTPHGEGGLLNWWLDHPAPGRPAKLTIQLSGPFRPGYVNDLRGARPEDRWLVPFPVLMPPLVGRERDHGGQAVMQVLVFFELRTFARMLAEKGSVWIPENRFQMLADEAAVPRRILPAVLDAWRSGTAAVPAFLVSPTAERWTLAAAYSRELATLVDAGRREVGGQVMGQRSAKARKRKYAKSVA